MPIQAHPTGATVLPVLEHYLETEGTLQRVVCQRFPFHIGRSDDAEYVIHSTTVSKQHAVLLSDSDGFSIRDLGSTNGTFVNGNRIFTALLHDRDIIHVAHKEFRFIVQPSPSPLDIPSAQTESLQTDAIQKKLPLSVICGREALQDVLRGQHVRIVFQPIVDLKTKATMGYEALGRGTNDELSPKPADLFHLAEKCGLAVQLSQLFRLVALQEAAQLAGSLCFFFNVHPAEMENMDFVNSLGAVATGFDRSQRLVMEVHENYVSDAPTMRRLRERLNALGIGLAYDDFGAGQARISELAEVPPDFLKLDMKLIRGIDKAPARQAVVRALTEVATRLGACVLAEGVETAAEADCCRQLGCHWAQGFLFGHPVPAAVLSGPRTATTKRVDLGPVLGKLKKG